MEESMKFNSSVCTTREQSKRLLELGLKPETADIYYFWLGGNDYYLKVDIDDNPLKYNMDKTYIPAWSLHRLIEICGIDRMPVSFHKKGKVRIRVNHINPTHDGRSGYNHYNSLIDCIEWLISEGYFNKEYLKEK